MNDETRHAREELEYLKNLLQILDLVSEYRLSGEGNKIRFHEWAQEEVKRILEHKTYKVQR